ncbi:non-ribosomal peptide synthetase [Paucibacter sp. XJ19-41]|uniref:non-ribosomal peptide synthetase n=1 Tax=Paucibacter sp. XJ19-41 TaxID=2927824 RepID=UPI00234946C6|nr:non-ribosomal peptide synthetase [Paucibacter sp. XJ19-41]MDC6169389.1 amino acid adenylation domain-containing protein [Paucibacter sp. XJ19-41]
MTSANALDSMQTDWLPRPLSRRSMLGEPVTLAARLRSLARNRPDGRALITVRADGASVIDTVYTYAELDQRVRALAANLQARFSIGDRALLLLNNDEHYVISFMACLYAGLVAVPVFPPESMREQHVARLRAIAEDCQAACLLTTSAMLPQLRQAGPVLASIEALVVDELATFAGNHESAQAWREHEPDIGDLAFLQYTSGSTATPKGVMVSHGNLAANEWAIEEGLSVGADDVFVSWLPLFHDMGLIGGLLQPIHRGIPVVLMTPAFFLERPLRWLETISRHRGTISGGPDFAYRLCVERVSEEQLRRLDLSCWRLAFSGAEPVRHDTLRAFIDRFAPAGFPAEAVYPCYGLAEATLFVTGGIRGQGLVSHGFSVERLRQGQAAVDAKAPLLVSCGSPVSGHDVEIMSTETLTSASDGEVGEIWASGPSLGQGYWGRPKETAQTFVEQDGRRWLRTGDLGFRHQGLLYVAGRLKDLIIVRGHNLYPQDLERTVEAEVEAVRKGRVAVFAVDGVDGEGIGLAAEVSRGMQKLVSAPTLVDALSRSVSQVCGEPLSVVLLLNPGALPKTSSGKLQRNACRLGWEEGTLDAYAVFEHGAFVRGGPAAVGMADRPREMSDDTAALAAIWREALERVTRRPAVVSPQTHFFASGGNSLAATQVVAGIAARWNLAVQPRLMFEHPVLSDCAVALARLREQTAPSDPVIGWAERIERLPRDRGRQAWPASHAQQRQWFLWHMEPASAAYHVGAALRLQGTVNGAFLRAALSALAAGHESLRTVFVPGSDGALMQEVRVLGAAGLPQLNEIDLRERDESMADLLGRLQREPFDLAEGPLWRVHLIHIADGEAVMLVLAHHIVTDGASMQLFFDELLRGYRAAAQGQILPPMEAALQYVDHAAWQRRWLAAGEGDRQLAYWRAQLGDSHPVLMLPADHPRPPVARYRAARMAIDLPDILVPSLRAAAQAGAVSVFMMLLAAFQGLLYRFTGQEDVRVGVPVANRRQPGAQDVIGFFVNTLVLRQVVDGKGSLGRLLHQVREASLGAQANPDLPFEQLVEALQPARSMAHSPLFQVMINLLQEDAGAVGDLAGLRAELLDLPEAEASFELTLELRELSDGRLRAHWVYAAELFEPATMVRLGHAYVCLLQALVGTPDMALADVNLLCPDDRDLLARWGQGEALGRADWDAVPVHRSLEEVARKRPDAMALVQGEQSLSHIELNRRANRLAHHLIDRGVRPETRVGVGMARGLDLFVALLAVWKAGGTCVPLDPAYPAERLAIMVADAGVGMLLTDESWPDERRVSGLNGYRWQTNAPNLLTQPDHDPCLSIHPGQLAYVIFTSGSTGQPKGVGVAHGPLAMHVQAIASRYGLGTEDRLLQFASASFDAAMEQWLAPLVAGGGVVVPDHDVRDPDRLEHEVRTQGVTILDLPPSYLRLMRQPKSPWSVRLVIAGGEAWSSGDLEAARRLGLAAQYINAYGPTEAVITPTAWTCDSQGSLPALSRHVPIGRPVGRRTAHVLDRDMNLVPPGVVGELYLGGEGLAQAYLGRAELTAKCFVPDPFDDQGGRLYRTGDQARWRHDGQLEALGRVDHQVKVRGFRVELAEVEAALLAQPGVREAMASVQGEGDDAKLVAHVSLEATTGPLSLRQELARLLPAYMVPSAIAVLGFLPRTSAGKLDRHALPPATLAAVEGEHEASRDPRERVMAAIWTDLLGLPQVGLHENFFDLGGHSLLLVRLQRQIETRLMAEVSVMELLQHPTVADMVRLLDRSADDRPRTVGGTQQQREERARRQRSTFVQRKPGAQKVPS